MPMKIVYLLRHAKSDWSNNGIADFDRPLNERGLWTAPLMGEILAERQILPDIIVTSPAKRALQTALLVKEAAGFNSPITYEERIYEATSGILLSIINQVSVEINSLMIVGHNPSMEGIISLLCNVFEPMPTAAVAGIELNIETWASVQPGTGNLKFLLRPKELLPRLK